MKEAKPEKKALTVEQLAKLGTAIIILCYGVGLLVVNSFLLHYGASDFNLFRARFIFTGLLMITVVGISTACPLSAFYCFRAWLRLPKFFQKKYATFDSLMAWDFLLFGLMILAAPYGMLRLILGQSNLGSLEGYWACGVTGGIILCAWYITVSRRKAAEKQAGEKAKPRQRAKSKRNDTRPKKLSKFAENSPPFWISYVSLGVFFVAYAAWMFIYFSQNVFPSVPAQLGGTRAQQVQLSIATDAAAGLRTLGLPFLSKTSNVTEAISLLFVGEDFYLVQSDGNSFVLSNDEVKGVEPLTYP